METTVPLLPCRSLAETLDFYRALGFDVTHEQTEPYLYGAVRRGGIALHFANLTVYGAKDAFGAYLAFVPDVGAYHRAFADGLRARYGRVPTAGVPRITRLERQRARFKVFDPGGNMVIFIARDESDDGYAWSGEERSGLAQALENAVFLRDTYANDRSAAGVLDGALVRDRTAPPVDRARALAARAELAVAMGDMERAGAVRRELGQLAISDADRERYRHELRAADDLAHWISRAGGGDSDGPASP